MRFRFRSEFRAQHRAGPCVFALAIRSSLTIPCRGTLLIRNRLPLGPYSGNMPRPLWWSWGGGQFLMSVVPLYPLQGWVPGAEHLQNAHHQALTTMQKWLNQTILAQHFPFAHGFARNAGLGVGRGAPPECQASGAGHDEEVAQPDHRPCLPGAPPL